MSSKGKVIIVEQPAPKLKRFRYLSEGRSAPLEGVNTTREKKTYPAIKIVGYTGTASVVVSCVTRDEPYRPHPHELVGDNCVKGVCHITDFTTDSNDPSILAFPQLRIQSCKVADIAERLNERKRLNIVPYNLSKYKDNLKRDIHSVRLCFQVIIRPDPNNPKYRIPLEPVVSQSISNRKDAAELKIYDISTTCSEMAGGKKIMIFCSKIAKEDIQIRFFELDSKDKETWVGWGKFQSHNVHRDVGIAFTTPKYELEVDHQEKKIFLELLRPSDNIRSDRLSFQYVSDVTSVDVIMSGKRRKVNESSNFLEFLADLSLENFHCNVPTPHI